MNSGIEQFGKYITPLTAILLIVSTLYDYLFLSSIGLTFFDVPTSFQDHARSALVWLPSLVPISLLFWIQFIIHWRISEGPESEKKPKRKYQSLMWTCTTLFAALMIVMIGKNPGYIFISVFYIILVAPSFWMRLLGVDMIKSFTLKVVILVACLVLPVVASKAYYDGVQLLADEHKWSVGVNTIDGNQMLFASGIRTFSESTIVIQIGGKINIIKNDDITGIELKEVVNYDVRYACRVLGWLCDT